MCIYDMYMFQYEGDLSELEAKLDSSKERVNKINYVYHSMYVMYMFQYEGDLSELEAQLASSKERVNKINHVYI